MPESAGLIGEAVEAALADELTGWTVVRRKSPSLPPKATPLPQAVVCVGAEAVEHLTGGADPWDLATYPVTVALFFADGGKSLGDDDAQRGTRRQVRGVLNLAATYAGVPGFCEVRPAGGPVFEPGALGANQVESVLTAEVQVLESRA